MDEETVIEAIRAVERRLIAAAGEQQTAEGTHVKMRPEQALLSFAGSDLPGEMVMANLVGAARLSGPSSVLMGFWLGWELRDRA